MKGITMTTYTSAEIRQKYQGFARRYIQRERLQELMGVTRLRAKLVRSATGRVLEVAVRTGANLPYYPRTCQITAVDLSQAMLDVAVERAQQLELPVTFRATDAEALDFPDCSFDTVVSSLSTCTFANPVAALREMSRVCRPGGSILLLEHRRSTSRLLGRLQDRLADRHARTLACQWNRDPLKLVQQAGISIVETHRTFFGIYHLIVASHSV
jgi:ubiquinone/menaquinone biosynthesis C-methylase UbiE